MFDKISSKNYMSLEKIFYFSIFIFYLLFLKSIFFIGKSIFSFSKNNSYFLFLFSKNIFILFYLKKKKHLIKKNKNYF